MERAGLALMLGRSPTGGDARQVVVEERDSARFRVAFATAVAGSGTVMVANPDWGPNERVQFERLRSAPPTQQGEQTDRGWLCLPTGGSSGRLKLARHDQDTLLPAIWGFASHFRFSEMNVVGVLPLHHVGGLMGWLRAELSGGEFLACEWKALAAGARPALAKHGTPWMVSLVPTQLRRLMDDPEAIAWLRGFQAILVGGGPAWAELAEAAAKAELRIAFTYGSTETAAAAAALRPEEFLEGRRGCGRSLPHAQIAIEGEGAIAIGGESMFRGYWPHWREPGAWESNDRGKFDAEGSLHVQGRRDALIVTGGEKVEPAEVEAALLATGEFDDVAVIGLPDAEWGSAVVACYPTAGPPPDWDRVTRGLAALAKWKRPKRFVALADWPRTAAGKIDRAELARLANGA